MPALSFSQRSVVVPVANGSSVSVFSNEDVTRLVGCRP